MTPTEDEGRDWAVRVPLGFQIGGWEIIARIATGSWGSVYEARPITSDAPLGPDSTTATAAEAEAGGTVAVKFLHAPSTSPGRRASLAADIAARERAFSQRADHPYLIRTFEMIEIEGTGTELDGCLALVMERAAIHLGQWWGRGNAGHDGDAERILTQLADGIRHIHAAGWVHADVKPSNVLLTDGGDVRICDFGLSAELDGTHAYALPRTGSLDYVPPEWWNARITPTGMAIRPSQDIWAWGVIAHQIFTGGSHPFPGATAHARSQTAAGYGAGVSSSSDLRLSGGVPPRWRALVTDCLARDPADRPSAEQVSERVRSIIDGADVRPDTRRRDGRARRRWRPNGRAAGVGALAATAVGIATTVAVMTTTDRGNKSALSVTVSRDCVIGSCTPEFPVLFLTSGATPGGSIRTIVAGPDGIDRNKAKPHAYKPIGQAAADGTKVGKWYFETGDPIGVWTVTTEDLATSERASTTFQVRLP
jgi:serine/threonine protein kinase